MGFKLNLAETDMWWLLECKNLHFPNSKFYFYDPDKDDKQKEMMLESYGVM